MTISKFYLKGTASGVGGTLPDSNDLSASTPTVTAAGASTNRVLDEDISLSSQLTQSGNTQANTNVQSMWLGRWITNPLGVNSFGPTGTVRGMEYRVGASEANANSNFFVIFGVWLWRPSSGAIVTTLFDDMTSTGGTTEAATSQGNIIGTVTFSSDDTSQDGDVIVIEAWRRALAQSMGTSYANNFFYAGTTEQSVTDVASFIRFFDAGSAVTPINMSGEGASPTSPPFRRRAGKWDGRDFDPWTTKGWA